MQLHSAAARGDRSGIAEALRCGASINAKDRSGCTALIAALERRRAFTRHAGPLVDAASIECLLHAGADPASTDQMGRSALHHAATIADAELVNILLRHGADARYVTAHGYSTIEHACRQPASAAKLQIIQTLHAAGASVDVASSYGEFPLGTCLFFGDLAALRLLASLGADERPLRWSALHRAALLDEAAAVQASGPTVAALEARSERFLCSPWSLALVRGEAPLLRWMVSVGVDPRQRGHCGASPAHVLAQYGHAEALAWYLDSVGGVDATDDFRHTPLHAAAEWNQVDCARELIRRGAPVRAENHVRAQPVHAARSLDMCRLLVEEGGADADVIDGCGEWPLKEAAGNNDVAWMRWLLERGVVVDRTGTGETALHAAVAADAREAIDLLLAAGADVNASDVDGFTPLFFAQSIEAIRQLQAAGADPRVRNQAGEDASCWMDDDPLLRAALQEG